MNKMRQLTIGLLSLLLLLVGCAPDEPEEIVQTENEQTKQEVSIVPNYQLTEESYKMILPFRPNRARGIIARQVSNRLDIDQVEEGLRRHSVDVFDPSEVFFEEGQYLRANTVIDWIDGLNPAREELETVADYRENPRHLSHVLEQNYLRKNDDQTVELVGVSIGLALKSVYHFQTETGGSVYQEPISPAETRAAGEDMAQVVLERLRGMDALQGVPIMIALYAEADRTSPVPGHFIAKTVVPGNDMLVGDWQEIDEAHVLFPSSTAKADYFEDYEIVANFGKEIATYFPNYVGYIGEGFYRNGVLQKLSIEIPIEFYGASEIVGFTQYTYGVVRSLFPNRYDLEIKIKSSEKMESVIYRKAGDETPLVHIFQ